MTHQKGATYARVIVPWSSIAPQTLPGNWTPTNPSSPYYHWSATDAIVSAANANGITPILTIMSPPDWGYHVQPAGTWKGGQPDIAKLGDFATAIATHYNGSVSPFAHVFAVWNEANFNRNFYPQSPTYYRDMVNAVAASVHAVNPADLVAAGELAPFKHPPTPTDKNNVMAPITWMQQMLCISSTTPAHRITGPGCPAGTKTNIDVWTHHPYSDTGPFGHAKVSGGVELGDLPKMTAMLKTAASLGAFSTSAPPQFWVTEFGWSTKPPNTHAAPVTLVTRWMGESFYQMWKSGVTVGTWFGLQDLPSSTPFQCGLYLSSASLSTAVAKPILTPFEFPFVSYLKSGGKVLVWGRNPTSNVQTVTIQMKKGSAAWKPVATIKSNSNGIFTAMLPVHALSTYSMRAFSLGKSSVVFKLAVPANENLRVIPFPSN
jgi:hypothetical protein